LSRERKIQAYIAGEVGEELFLGEAWSCVGHKQYVGEDYPKAVGIAEAILRDRGTLKANPEFSEEFMSNSVSQEDAADFTAKCNQIKEFNKNAHIEFLDTFWVAVRVILEKKRPAIERLVELLSHTSTLPGERVMQEIEKICPGKSQN
jgi:hypothetical protein